jgi:hypothetical protein
MARSCSSIAVLVTSLALLSCSSGKAKAVLIVNGETVSVLGEEVEFVNVGGRFQAVVWVSGNVVIFRTQGELEGAKGEAAGIYRIKKDNTLARIGTADLSLRDEVLASQFVKVMRY